MGKIVGSVYWIDKGKPATKLVTAERAFADAAQAVEIPRFGIRWLRSVPDEVMRFFGINVLGECVGGCSYRTTDHLTHLG